MQTSADVQRATASHLIVGPSRGPATDGRTDIFGALMDALTTGERYLLVELGGELHLVEHPQ
jgi:hypothetical protein